MATRQADIQDKQSQKKRETPFEDDYRAAEATEKAGQGSAAKNAIDAELKLKADMTYAEVCSGKVGWVMRMGNLCSYFRTVLPAAEENELRKMIQAFDPRCATPLQLQAFHTGRHLTKGCFSAKTQEMWLAPTEKDHNKLEKSLGMEFEDIVDQILYQCCKILKVDFDLQAGKAIEARKAIAEELRKYTPQGGCDKLECLRNHANPFLRQAPACLDQLIFMLNQVPAVAADHLKLAARQPSASAAPAKHVLLSPAAQAANGMSSFSNTDGISHPLAQAPISPGGPSLVAANGTSQHPSPQSVVVPDEQPDADPFPLHNTAEMDKLGSATPSKKVVTKP